MVYLMNKGYRKSFCLFYKFCKVLVNSVFISEKFFCIIKQYSKFLVNFSDFGKARKKDYIAK